MPDDPLIPDANASRGDPPTTPAQAPAATVDAAQLQSIVAEQVKLSQEATNAEIAELRNQNQTLQREVVGLRQQAVAPTPTPDPYAGGSSDDFLTNFMANPDGVLTAKMTSVIQPMFQQFAGEMAPIVQQINAGMSTSLTDQHRVRVDSEFGTGTFDEKFKPLLDRRIQAESDRGQPLRASEGAWMESELNAIKGHLFNDLAEKRTAHQKAVSEGREKDQASLADDVTNRVTTNLGPGGISNRFFSAEGTEPTPAEQDFLNARNKAVGGEPVTFEQIRTVDADMDYDAYVASIDTKSNGRAN